MFVPGIAIDMAVVDVAMVEIEVFLSVVVARMIGVVSKSWGLGRGVHGRDARVKYFHSLGPTNRDRDRPGQPTFG